MKKPAIPSFHLRVTWRVYYSARSTVVQGLSSLAEQPPPPSSSDSHDSHHASSSARALGDSPLALTAVRCSHHYASSLRWIGGYNSVRELLVRASGPRPRALGLIAMGYPMDQHRSPTMYQPIAIRNSLDYRLPLVSGAGTAQVRLRSLS